MDAVKYLKTKQRMCAAHRRECKHCPLSLDNNGVELNCYMFQECRPEEAVAIVEKWASEHPAKTRQSEFLKMFPNAPFEPYFGIGINPCDTDKRYGAGDKYEHNCLGVSCNDCRRKYWLEEIE